MPCCLSYSLILLQQLTTESGTDRPVAAPQRFSSAPGGTSVVFPRRTGRVLL